MTPTAVPGAEPDIVKYDAADGKRNLIVGADRLVVPGSKQRRFVQRFIQTPLENTLCLETRTGQWLFDSQSGELKKLPNEAPQPASADAFSPRADHTVFRRGRNLSVVDLATGRVTALTNDDERGELENGDANWSPDGRRIAYVRTDASKVRRRATIQPTDPSYPGVRLDRFARVGTPIPTLRVGVVDREGGATRWVKLPAEPGTFYIQDISWAGNSTELLIEMQGRSRDHRKFLLANVETGEVAAYEETDPAWVDASYAANAGLEWIRSGKDFVLICERDGWRQAYLVVSMDGGGTPAPKETAWRRAVYGSLGPLSTEEQAAGVNELGRIRSYVDLSRVGIWGGAAAARTP